MTNCHFCAEPKKLIDSHLIPLCMHSIPEAMPLAVVQMGGRARPKRSQQGVYDSNILCRDCDNFFGVWDNHACKTLHKDRRALRIASVIGGPAIDKDGNVLCYEVLNANPASLSLFALSVVWRCHLSKREEARGFNLGSHAEAFQEILRKSLPPDQHPYAVILEFNPDLDVIMWIGRWRNEGMVINSFCAQGFTFHVKTDRQAAREPFEDLRLLKDKPVLALVINKLATPLGKKVVGSLRRTNERYGDPWRGLRKKK